MALSSLAGDLNPPAGVFAPTLKNLQAVEPRVEINVTNTPGDADSVFRIVQSGSYYLTGNISGEPGKPPRVVDDKVHLTRDAAFHAVFLLRINDLLES